MNYTWFNTSRQYPRPGQQNWMRRNCIFVEPAHYVYVFCLDWV
jgi:hypothetical protein